MAEGAAKTAFQRVQLACTPCHRGKLKCNRELVCNQCLKRSRAAQCVYTERGLRRNTARQHAASMRAKLDDLEKFLTCLKDDSECDVQLSESHDRVLQNDECIANTTPYLKIKSRSQPAGNIYHISPSHWESVMENISDVKAYFETENEQESLNGAERFELRSVSDHSDSYLGSPDISTKVDLLHRLPSRFDTDRLIGSWYNGIDPLRMIVHAPSFQVDYQGFWQNPAAVDTQWLAMLFAIVTLGAEISGQVREDAATLAMADYLRKMTAHAIHLADCTTMRRWGLETLLLHARAFLLRKHDTDVHVCLLIGLGTRMAIMTGFHLDSSRDTVISPYVCEMRRRIWACVCEYDIGTCYQSGAFSAIVRTKNDTLPPANLLDTDFSRESVPPGRPPEEYTTALHCMHCSDLTSVFGDIVHASENLQSSTRVDTDILYQRLVQARDSWPEVLRLTPFNPTFTDSKEIIHNRYKLEFLFLKAVCVLYRKHLDTPGPEQERCLQAAEDMVRVQSSMLEHARPGNVLATSVVFLKYHVHDFNLATMLLCLDMAHSARSSTTLDTPSRHMRLRLMIIQACNLWLEIGVPSRRARHAITAVLRFLRPEQDRQPAIAEMSSITESNAEVDQDAATIAMCSHTSFPLPSISATSQDPNLCFDGLTGDGEPYNGFVMLNDGYDYL